MVGLGLVVGRAGGRAPGGCVAGLEYVSIRNWISINKTNKPGGLGSKLQEEGDKEEVARGGGGDTECSNLLSFFFPKEKERQKAVSTALGHNSTRRGAVRSGRVGER